MSAASGDRRGKRLQARAEWHFGGGPEYCRGCGGNCDCPYERNAPLTEAGWQAWELLTGSIGTIRLGPRGGITGLDLPALLIQAQALGYDRPLLARLLPFAERGMVTGSAKVQTETTKSVSIRLSLQDGETVRRALMQLGEDGQKALARIEGAAQPASKSLLAINAASQDIQGGMAAFASRLGPIGSVMMALGPAGLAAGAAIGLFGKAMIESIIKVESLEARLKGLVGAAALTETTTYLYAQAQKTSTALETVINAYSRLAALQKAGITTSGESRALLEGFQSTAIALGASSEQLEQSLFGLAQGLEAAAEAVADPRIDEDGWAGGRASPRGGGAAHPGERAQALLTILYCSTDCLCRRGAAV